MAIVCIVSRNGYGPAVMLGTILEILSTLLPKVKYVFKTPSAERFDFVKRNYCKNLCYLPTYQIRTQDIVLHIIDPRNIPSHGKDIFIDNMGDYWNYLFEHNLFLERLNLFKRGIINSNYYFLSSLLLKKTPWGNKYNRVLFVDNRITQTKTTSNGGLVVVGSYKTKNLLWDKKYLSHLKPLFCKERNEFVNIIAKSKMIITHPGMCSISESLYLNKPYVYMHPANLEQNLNVDIIKKYDLGLIIQDSIIKSGQTIDLEFESKKQLFIKNIQRFKKQRGLYKEMQLFNFLKGVVDDI